MTSARSLTPFSLFGAIALVLGGGCAGDDALATAVDDTLPAKTDADYKEELTRAAHGSVLSDLREFVRASNALCARAPLRQGKGWDRVEDEPAILQMKSEWMHARRAYERIEGPLAELYPDIDYRVDARYDDFLARLGPEGDENLFDHEGVTGMHAIERILYADAMPAKVREVESSIPGYAPARLPETQAEASDFQSKLCTRFILDARMLEASWEKQALDAAGMFSATVALLTEQREKIVRASSAEEESRYAQTTLADLRANLEGTRAIYEFFRPWLATRSGGAAIDTRVVSGFEKLSAVYAAYPGDMLPPVPASWEAENPSPADRASPFGQLWTQVRASVDPARADSLVHAMSEAAAALDIAKPSTP